MQYAFLFTAYYNCSSLESIYASDNFNTNNVTKDDEMFSNCTKLVGGNGTIYDLNFIDKTYARIDGGTDNKGYFRLKQ